MSAATTALAAPAATPANAAQLNRLRDPKTDIGKFSAMAVQNYGKADTRYLLQGRDDNTGSWVSSQLHTPLGATQGKALK